MLDSINNTNETREKHDMEVMTDKMTLRILKLKNLIYETERPQKIQIEFET